MKHQFLLFCSALFTGFCVNASGNLVYNSSFELENAGWNMHTIAKICNPTGEIPSAVSYPEGDSVSGKRALRIEARPENMQTLVTSYNFPVKKNTDYTVSYYVKRDKPGRSTFFLDLVSKQRKVSYDASGRAKPETGWNNTARVVFTQTGRSLVKPPEKWTRFTKTFNSGFHTAFCIRIHVGGGTGVYLVDDIQVEEGRSATAYAPKAPLELSVSTKENLYEEPQEITGKVTAVSYNGDLKQKIGITLMDDFNDREIAKQELSLDLKKGETAEIPFEFKGKLPYGSYQIFSSLQPRTTTGGFIRDLSIQAESVGFKRIKADDEAELSAAKFVAVPHPNEKTKDGFRIGTTGSYTRNEARYAVTQYGDTQNHLKLVRLAGGNVHRSWDSALALWKTVEPEQDKFQWAQTDYEMKQAEKAGLDVMCVIGGMFSTKSGIEIFLPKWVLDRDRSSNGKGTPVPKNFYFGQRFKVNYFRPQLSDWRKYVSAVASRYKGRIKYYEILNESNLYMDAATYMEYMKAAAEEIRKADPDATILGLCATSDFGVKMDGFIGQSLKLGADRYMDHMTIHPYAKLDNSDHPNQMEMRRSLLAAMKKNGAKAGLWNGENYFAIPSWFPAADFAGRSLPEDVARHLIIDMGEGCTGTMATHFQTLTTGRGRGLMVDVPALSRIPDARFSAHAAAAHFIAGAKPAATHDLPLGALGYTFRRGDKLYTAIWNSRAPVPTELNVPPMPHKVYDMMANPYESKGRLPLNTKPWYIEWGNGVKAEDVVTWMNKNPIRCDVPFLIERVLIGRDGDASRLVFSAKNLTGKALDRIPLTAGSPAFKASCGQMGRDWKDFSDFIFSIPVELTKDGNFDVTFTSKDFPEFKLTRPVVQTGMVVLGKAPYKTEIAKTIHGKPSSPEDLSAKMELQKDMKGRLWLTVDVKDDKKGKTSKDAWDSDCIELFIDRDPFSGDPAKYNSKTLQLLFPRNIKKQRLHGVSCEITDREDGYTAKICIPVKYEDALGLEVAIDDSDADHRKCQLAWSSSANPAVDRSGFKLIRIAPSFNSRIDIPVKNAEGKLLRYNLSDKAGRDWTPNSFTVTPDRDGKLQIAFLSGYSKREQYPAEYRRIKVTGGTLRNGDFAELKADGTPKEWYCRKPSGIRMENGEIVLRTMHDFPCRGYIDAKAGVPVTVSYESRVLVK